MPKLPITVLLITFNEAHYLPGALENVRDWAEEVFVVDSLSTDGTVDIALEHGARVVQRPFRNFGDQWNFAVSRLPIRTQWTIKLDPDERFSPELISELTRTLCDEPEYDGYALNRRLWFMGQPLTVQAEVLRVWKTGKCRFSDVIVNEHPIINGRVGRLKGLLEHYDSPNLHHWLEKQNRCTTMEAIMRVQRHKLAADPNLFGSALQRRMFLKRHFHRIPFRYIALWLYLMFIQGAWRSARAGRVWARMRVEVMRMRELKAEEMLTTGCIPQLPESRTPDMGSCENVRFRGSDDASHGEMEAQG